MLCDGDCVRPGNELCCNGLQPATDALGGELCNELPFCDEPSFPRLRLGQDSPARLSAITPSPLSHLFFFSVLCLLSSLDHEAAALVFSKHMHVGSSSAGHGGLSADCPLDLPVGRSVPPPETSFLGLSAASCVALPLPGRQPVLVEGRGLVVAARSTCDLS